MLFHSAAFKTRHSLQITLTIDPLRKGSSGSCWYQSTKWNSSFTLYPLVSMVSWFCCSSLLMTFLVTKGLRSTLCYPCIVLPLLGSSEASSLCSDSLKSETSRSDQASSFTFSLAFTVNNNQGVENFAFFLYFAFPYASSESTTGLGSISKFLVVTFTFSNFYL